jgi:SAM-dependent methyltransferase
VGKVLKGLKDKINSVKYSIKNPGRTSSSTYVKYPPNYDFNGRKVLNLGCGTTVYKFKNVVNLDMFKGEGIDCVHNLTKPLPFKDNEFDFIIANMILEHVPNWFECFKELARVLKVGGILEIWLPGDGGSSQLGYRDHINIINDFSFYGIRGTMRNYANSWEIEERKNLGRVVDLQMTRNRAVKMMNFWWIQIMPQNIQIWMANYLRNTVQELGYEFIKLPKETDGRN